MESLIMMACTRKFRKIEFYDPVPSPNIVAYFSAGYVMTVEYKHGRFHVHCRCVHNEDQEFHVVFRSLKALMAANLTPRLEAIGHGGYLFD